MKKICKNHPNKKALSFCHTCGEYFCEKCLQVYGDYYYCQEHISKIESNFSIEYSEKKKIDLITEWFHEHFKLLDHILEKLLDKTSIVQTFWQRAV